MRVITFTCTYMCIHVYSVCLSACLSICLSVCLSVCLVQDASVDVLHGFVEHLELEDTEAQGR